MDKEKVADLIDENYYKIEELLDQKMQIWSDYVVFSGLWWLGVILSVAPWILWILLRNKQSTDRILYAGFLSTILALMLDVLGDQYGLWHYRFNVIPLIPTYFPWDVTLMPVGIMFLLQLKPEGSPYLKALVFALITSYAAEPFFQWLGIYQPMKWHHTYSVPIQFGLYLLAHYFSRRQKFQELA
ncbi:CBO0543 family protein [Paenibacillus sp. MMO-177]|uniref:CBO0543 family protein n=1 Tax=Paenibacillus sp. MMO-177 TaxID=3081289 RepID=UPI003015A7E2